MTEPEAKTFQAQVTVLDRDVARDLSLPEAARNQVNAGLGQALLEAVGNLPFLIQVFRVESRVDGRDPGTLYTVRLDATPILEIAQPEPALV